MTKAKLLEILRDNGGILKCAPTFIPRFCGHAGRRLRLHPDDYYPLGVKRGAIKERWFVSTIPAANGPDAAPDEGMSYVNTDNTQEGKILFKEFVDVLQEDLIGKRIYEKYGTWPMYAKFYDFEGALFHHLHLDFAAAARVGKLGKPEAYYYPPQYNNYPGKFPHTYFGFDPDVTKDEVKDRLKMFCEGDNRITELSRAFRIQLGTGWYTPPGVIHAPGSYLTYEPQWNADVNSVFENVADEETFDYSFLAENCPEDKQLDLDYIMSLLDWDKNVDPHYRDHYFRPPVVLRETEDYVEKEVVYGNDYLYAKELTIYPGKEITIQDPTSYGVILTQGYGMLGQHHCAAASMLRFGQFSEDEFFISGDAAEKGVVIKNLSAYEPLVMLKHSPKI